MKKKKIIAVVMGIISFIWFIPIYFMIINSFKPFKEVTLYTAKFPTSLYLDNFVEIFSQTQYLGLLFNSVMITACSVAGIVITGSMLGYRMARWKNKYPTMIMAYLSLAVLIPFQAIMIPLIKVMRTIGVVDTRVGIVLVYMTLGLPMSAFLYKAYIMKIPVSIEENAKIDGAGLLLIYGKIILPIVKPLTSTVIILQASYIWNDFLLPLIVLQSKNKYTIPVGMGMVVFGEYSNKWNYGIASALMASLPMIILFIFLQKYIIKGLVDGAVKG